MTSLQYADDIILFLDLKRNYARNTKLLLSCFDQLSGMKIYYEKCDLLTINLYAELLSFYLNFLLQDWLLSSQLSGCSLALS